MVPAHQFAFCPSEAPFSVHLLRLLMLQPALGQFELERHHWEGSLGVLCLLRKGSRPCMFLRLLLLRRLLP
jgi:hypothetical protein